MSVKRPSKVSIMGIEYKIKYLPSKQIDGDQGQAIFETRTIKILETLDEANANSTLLHEIIHVILYMTGQVEHLDGDKAEESLVLALEHGLTPLVDLRVLKVS